MTSRNDDSGASRGVGFGSGFGLGLAVGLCQTLAVATTTNRYCSYLFIDFLIKSFPNLALARKLFPHASD